MRALDTAVRRVLSDAVLSGRREAESACWAAVEGLGVLADRRPEHLTEEQVELRIGLRAKWRQLGRRDELLVSECAYEQWHRLLFARFLAENGLLLHPEFLAPVSIAECEDLAPDLGEPDGWSVAARFAAEILPGIFRRDDPCVKLRLAPEGRDALERIVTGIPAEVFSADDALGWVYQFWQKNKKDEINNSERKIGGADLGPVTQLFTENYMVRFLLENSLGAWWAGRHPDSPLLGGFDYLRLDDEGNPAAGTFEEWPTKVAEVTVMDPCCGSGHFLVEAFSMLWQMRAEEEQLDPVVAQDAVLRDNLFGLELDPRCAQIAMFAVALQAWKAGDGWRELPTPSIACSGIPVKAPVEEWTALAEGNERLENALVRLHILFQEANTLGSLIDPKRTTEISDPTGLQISTEDVEWDEINPIIERAAQKEANDPATAVLGAEITGIARAADLLSRQYTLVATNPPYLGLERMSPPLQFFLNRWHPRAKRELALTMLERGKVMVNESKGALALVLPSQWTFVRASRDFRKWALGYLRFRLIARLGEDSFVTKLRVSPILAVISSAPPFSDIWTVDVKNRQFGEKPSGLISTPTAKIHRADWTRAPDHRLLFSSHLNTSDNSEAPLGDSSDARNGMSAGDGERFERLFWEIPDRGTQWELLQSAPENFLAYSGLSKVVYWEEGRGSMASLARSVKHLNHAAQNWKRGAPLWNKKGVVVSQIGARVSVYLGNCFDSSCFAIVPDSQDDLLALVAYGLSGELKNQLGIINPTWKLGSPKTLLQLQFDADHWRKVAEEKYPNGLPEPYSDDPTQWLFAGRPDASTDPLQVAVARLLGYGWPEQSDFDDLDSFADTDGIVCLPSVKGEAPAVDRLNSLLAAAYGESWSGSKANQLIEQAGSKKTGLADWLRDDFFKQHCAGFGKRPFIWHIWDGHRDGFSALVNYHRLDHNNFERLTYTYLGDWIERQRAATADDTTGADERLASALRLQGKLEAILEGESPYDIYVRWKEKREQPIGWNPDLNDGVRLNIRPFVEAGVLRSKFSIHWNKDRGKNPDGSERHNDLHLTLAEKRAAREGTRT